MRLTIVTHNVVRGDGQGRVNYEIARQALARCVGVRLVADVVDPCLLDAGAEWIPVRPRLRRINLFKVRESAARADRALAALEPATDVLHANGYVLGRAHHVNTAHFVHGAWRRSRVHTARVRRNLNAAYQWVYSALNARWERTAFANARTVIAVSRLVAEQLCGIGVPASKIRVILNGVDPAEFCPGRVDRPTLGLPDRVPLALFAGDIRSPRKNLDTVLRAMTVLPRLHLAVAGATEGSSYPAMARRLAVEERVHFLGYRRDVAQLMRAADLFVFPSRYEACSLALLEALASGLPVVTARSAGGAEVVGPECGIVIDDPDDAPALTQAIGGLIDDPARRRAMADAARAVAEKHSWRKMAEQYLRLYAEVAP